MKRRGEGSTDPYGCDGFKIINNSTLKVGTGIYFSNAIFCTKFGTALKSKLNELK